MCMVGTRRSKKAMVVKVLMVTVVAEYWLIERRPPKNLSLRQARKYTGACHKTYSIADVLAVNQSQQVMPAT